MAARWLAVLFATGGTIGLLSMLVPHWRRTDTAAIAAISLSAYPAALFVMGCRRRLGVLPLHVLVAYGTLLITAAVYFGHGGTGSIVMAMLYIWIALYACLFFSLPRASMHVGLAGLGFGVVLWLARFEGAVASWVFVIGTAAVSGAVVSGLVRQLRTITRVDDLTGLLNRRALKEEIVRELTRAKRSGLALSVVMLDLDRFKERNDTLGHHGGDALLIEAARAWTSRLRGTDRLARYGGDEFVLVLPDASVEAAVSLVGRLRAASPSGLVFSAGVTSWDGNETADQLLRRADEACYRAKRDGGDRSAIVSPERPSRHAPTSAVGIGVRPGDRRDTTHPPAANQRGWAGRSRRTRQEG